jgi:hypothetical protein
MIRASVVERLSKSATTGRGDFDFLQLPAPGDRMTLGNNRGSNDIMEVIYVEHRPLPAERFPSSPPIATAMIFVHEIGSDDD